jgi:EAL domain-containing protein (putative c-di-GMP-specific phosphodiesterase class I)
MAERLERVHELGRVIRGRATEDLEGASGDATLFLNLHPRDIEDDELYTIGSPLSTIADRVVLEITERASLEGVTDVAHRIANLKDIGYRIAVDDLGAGYAGLTSLANLDPNVVKLDMSLIRDVDRQPTRQKLIGSFIELGRELGMMLICEGIETEAERDTLADLGCRYMQGYLFARPQRGFADVRF